MQETNPAQREQISDEVIKWKVFKVYKVENLKYLKTFKLSTFSNTGL